MNKITCDICMDLMPLVRDNVASADSITVVKEHIEICPECRAIYEGQIPTPSDSNQIIKKIQRKMHTFLSMVLMFGVFFGLSLTAGNELFLNSLIMPILGCIGYYLFRWKALYITPGLLLITHLITNTLGLINNTEHLDILPLLMWTAMYSFFSVIGTIIVGLIHFALRKEDNMKKKHFKIIALVTAIILVIGLGCLANALLGNPISKMLATNTAKKHLAETYAGTDYYIERIAYSFKDGKYHAFIKSPTSMDTEFSLTITMLGELHLDTYEAVVNGFNTACRVDYDYRELTDTIFENPSFPYTCHISYGTLEIYSEEALADSERNDIPTYAINQKELELDKIYDIGDLGQQAGHLIIYVESDTVTMERATEIILDIKSIFDSAGIPFKAIDFTLQYPGSEEGKRPEGEVSIADFPYEEIYEDGMLERVQEADKALKAYYEEQDSKDK